MNKLGQFAAACVAVVFAVGACGSLLGEICTFTDGAWDVTPSGAADDIVIVSGDLTWGASLPAKVASWTQSGGTVTFQTKYGADPFEVTGDVALTGGTWTHTANSSAETYRLAVTVGGSFILGSDGMINLSGKGYAKTKGPGTGSDSTGASYGGQGTSKTAGGLNCYGSVARPVNLGSGGKYNAGGGALMLTVGAACTINGSILCDSEAVRTDYCAGSGGSVLIFAESFAGSGTVSASGGMLSQNYLAGGGRISFVLTGVNETFDSFAATATVKAWPTTRDGAVLSAGAGTIYYETAADGLGKGRLVVDRGSTAGSTASPLSIINLDQQEAEFDPKEICLTNGASVKVVGGTRKNFKVGERVFISGNGALTFTDTVLDLTTATLDGANGTTRTLTLGAGTTLIDNDLVCEGLTIRVSGADVALAVDSITLRNAGGLAFPRQYAYEGPVTVENGGVLTVDAPMSVTGNVLVKDGGMITHTVNTADTDYRLDLTVDGNLTVEEGGRISAKAKGYPAKVGPGAGMSRDGAGCHGGHGRDAKNSDNGDGVCYGSITKPTELGSGTLCYNSNEVNLHGGGSVLLSVTGSVTNNGRIDANGDGQAVNCATPGGSVWITCATLSGAGKIEANAYGDNGNATSERSLSGGGRVAVWLTQVGAGFDGCAEGSITAYGARKSKGYAGGAGTVYLKTGDQAANEGTLIIDNAMQSGCTPWYTEIGSEVTETEVGSVIIRNGGYLRLMDGATLTVNGDWTLDATGKFKAEEGTTVAFAGEATAHLSGDTTFSRFSCQTPGKTLTFADGMRVSVAANGKFAIEGGLETPVVLRSETEEVVWNLAVDESAEVSVSGASVFDSDASAGAEIVGLNSEATRCTNWKTSKVVVGETITWTGAAGSSGWGIAGNWDLGRAPVPTDFIVIPAGAENAPTLSADTTAASLAVAAGATLALNGYALTVSGACAVTGTLETVGTEAITVDGDATFAAGSIGRVPPQEIVLGGTAAQAFEPQGNVFGRVTFANTSAEGITVGSSFAASCWNAAGETATAVRFADGVTVTVNVMLTLVGDPSAKSLALATCSGSGSWNLALKGVATVSGVAVSGSQATGNTIVATDSTDNGGNDNWIFGAVVAKTWTGAVNADFNEPGNWADGEVPGEDDSVTIDSSMPVTVSTPVKIRELILGGEAATTFTANAPVEVVGAMLVKGRATAVLNRPVAVGGSVVMESGAIITHDKNESLASDNRVDLAIGGDMIVPDGAFLDVTGKGYVDCGPGKSTNSAGGSYGGRGGSVKMTPDEVIACYGSVFCPTNIGSAGRSGTASNARIGGGAVKVSVGGTLELDGTISADGSTFTGYCAGSGGSVWITAGRLTGGGAITAKGGRASSNGGYGAGGGRIALYLTNEGSSFDEFTGPVVAYGEAAYGDVLDVPIAAPGTVYKQGPGEADYCGTIYISNDERSGTHKLLTDYPSTRYTSDPRKIGGRIVMEGAGNLNLTANATVADIVMTGSKPKLYLNGHKLRVKAERHALGAATDPDWTKNAQIIPGEDADGNPGTIVWGSIGMIIIVN